MQGWVLRYCQTYPIVIDKTSFMLAFVQRLMMKPRLAVAPIVVEMQSCVFAALFSHRIMRAGNRQETAVPHAPPSLPDVLRNQESVLSQLSLNILADCKEVPSLSISRLVYCWT
jgi:hypothetical protein